MAVPSRPHEGARPWAAPRPGHASRPGGGASRSRPLLLLAVALVLAATVWGRLAYWQVGQHAQLSRLAAAYHVARTPLPASRGLIYDRDMSPIAVNTTVYDVTLAPDQVNPQDRARVAGALAAALGLQPADLVRKLASGLPFAYAARRQPKDTADRVRQMALPGVGLEQLEQRTYLQGGTPDVSLASSVLGFVDYAGHGQRGVEQEFDARLAGRAGYVLGDRDLYDNAIALGDQRRREPANGADLVLTLDSSVQYAAEKAIADGVKGAHAAGGSVIVLDSKTGAVVASATYPAYDANQFTTADPRRTADPTVSSLYEPGSVMKVVTLAGALDAGKITPATTIRDPGYVVVGGAALHDWNGIDNGTVTMTNVLEKSLNVGAVRAEQMEGRDAFFHYLDAFGFGRPSGVDLSGESFVAPRPPAQWREAEVATAAFGQGIAVDMMQMCAAINVIANGGRWVQPHVVASVGGAAVAYPPPRQVVRPETAATMARMMESVVQNGSGWTARVPGFELDQAGKTGTSQIPENGGYSPDHVWASYAGFLPAGDPRFTMLVVIQQPDNGSADHNEGYYVAAPIWKQIAEQLILQWRITPEPPGPSN